MSVKWPSSKDPDDILDYDVDWTARVPVDDSIIESVFTNITTGSTVTVETSSISTDGHKTTVWLAGGTDGETASILNRVVTQAGRQMDQTVQLKVKSR